MKLYHHGYGGNTKALILLRPNYLKKQTPYSNTIWLLASLSFFVLIFLVIFVHTRDSSSPSSMKIVSRSATRKIARHSTLTTSVMSPPLLSDEEDMRKTVDTRTIDTLLYYASMSNETYRMRHEEMRSIVDVLLECSPPCNFLVFGLSPETLLWHALNHNGRTVFVDENRYYAAYFEEVHRVSEVYDIVYTTKLADKDELLQELVQSGQDCRPVQNLLFTECKLGINDLPNHMYDMDWDVILVDGPSEAEPDDPGRMMPIFTAGVLARSKKGGGGVGKGITHVFLHDYYGDVEKVYGDEFLCRENLVEVSTSGMLAHFVVERMEESDGVSSSQFCREQRRGLTVES
ncbi:Protein IRX15-LIKE [Linum perenne]